MSAFRRLKHKFWDIAINSIAASALVPTNVRLKIYRSLGMEMYAAAVFPQCYFRSANIKVGKGSWLNNECFFDNDISSVQIGDNCGIGMQVMFCLTSHEVGSAERRAGAPLKSSIFIQDGCWIGARVTILPGVTVGKGCIIAAGSVITMDCEPNGLYAGVPAKRLRDLPV